MHAEHGAWPAPSLACCFALVFIWRWLTLPMDLVGNHNILSMFLNSTLGTRHLKLDPVAQLCQSLFLDLTSQGSAWAPVEVPLPGEEGKED